MRLYPAIDVKDGQCVRLKKGLFNEVTVYSERPYEIAKGFEEAGAQFIHTVDLDGALKGHGVNAETIKKICSSVNVPVQMGGGIRTLENIQEVLDLGVYRVIIGTKAVENPDFIKAAIDRFGAEHIVVGVDAKDGLVAIEGWEKVSDKTALSLALAMKDIGVQTIVYTDISKDGMLTGPNVEQTKILSDKTGIDIIASGGMSCMDDLTHINDAGIHGAIIGKAIYEKRIDLKEAVNLFESGASYSKASAMPKADILFKDLKLDANGLIPVVVQDYVNGEVLMLAYMNEEAYNKTLETGIMTYYSRSRQELWIKGLTSGHFQYVRSIEIDCDNDTLLAKVKQIGAACHTGNKSCFYRNLVSTEYAQTNPLKVFNNVMSIIEDRKQHPKEGSYTNYLFDKGIDKILKKCGEEATEVIIAAKNPDPEEIKYEISDFLYHVMVLMVLKGVTWEDIVKELANR